MIIYNDLHRYYDQQCSHESWSSLLMSPLPKTMEVKGYFKCFVNLWKKGHFKRQKQLFLLL